MTELKKTHSVFLLKTKLKNLTSFETRLKKYNSIKIHASFD